MLWFVAMAQAKQTKLAAMIVWPVDRDDILGGTITLGIGWIARRNWLWSSFVNNVPVDLLCGGGGRQGM